jgi:hypothetical protein
MFYKINKKQKNRVLELLIDLSPLISLNFEIKYGYLNNVIFYMSVCLDIVWYGLVLYVSKLLTNGKL